SASVKVPVFGFGPTRFAKPFSSQFVGNTNPFCTPNGNPLVHFPSPDQVHPPAMASKPRFHPFPQRFCRPNGSSYTQLLLIWCVMSYSDTARNKPGSKGL